jgi:hypothetical protein
MNLVKKHGGKPEICVTDACTHLVTSEADIQKASKCKLYFSSIFYDNFSGAVIISG